MQPVSTEACPNLFLVCTAQKEEANSQSTVSGHQLDEDNARWGPSENGAAPERGDDGSTNVMESETGLKPKNHSAQGVGRDAHSPHPGTGMQARGGVGVAGPTLASLEGSGDLDLVVEVDGGVSLVPQSRHPSKAMEGNRSGVKSEEDRNDGAPGGVPVEGAMTVGRERAPTTTGAVDEGSGEATVPGQGQEGVMQGTGMGGTALTSVTEKMENIQVDTKGVDEYTYIPDSGSITVTRGKVGSTAKATSFTQISPDKDDKVNIFIGRAKVHVGEQETSQGGGSKDGNIPTAGTSSPLPGLGITVAHDGNDNDGIPAHGQPEGPVTTAIPSHGDSVTSSSGDSHPTGDGEDGHTSAGDGAGPVAPGPWRVASGDITVPAGAGTRGNGDSEGRGESQRSDGRLGHLAVTTPHQQADEEATAAVPAKGVRVRLGATMASPGVSKGDCTTVLGMAGGRKASQHTTAGRGGSGEVGPATPQPRGEGQPGAGARVQPGGAGLNKPPSTDQVVPPRRKAGSRASSGTQASAGGHGSDARGRQRATDVGGSLLPQAGRAGGSAAAREGWEQGRGGETSVSVVGAGVGRLPRRHGRRLGAGEPGAFAALGHSRQVDHVKHSDELHVRERAFYTLGRAGGSPHGPYTALGSADSSQSSEAERGSHSDSRQTGLRPSGWGAPGHPHGRWSRGTL